VPIYVATAGPLNAKRTGKYADGIITVGAADEKIAMLWDKFREGATEAGKDASAMKTQLQIHVSWAPTQGEAERNALEEWPNGGMPFPKQDIKNPEDFANIAKLVRIENFANRMLISPDLEEHTAQIQKFVDMGFDEIYLHNVGRDQATFIETFATKVLPNLKLS
jgi:alkanesulfonate monooxygenase SsuD/methylene tetrahydromethanopterin reductase-like flavin-dependent oxidoreductase (luciferase family)